MLNQRIQRSSSFHIRTLLHFYATCDCVSCARCLRIVRHSAFLQKISKCKAAGLMSRPVASILFAKKISIITCYVTLKGVPKTVAYDFLPVASESG